MPPAKRQALVVLGMHRSGTSATAGVLSLLGASEPRHLMPPTPDNPKGYWESVLLMTFHDDLLHAGGSAWDDWSPIADSWFDSATAQEARARIPSLLSEEFGDADLVLLKDPRLCRLMPLWAPALRDDDTEPLVVLTMRGALDVAESLRARDDFDIRRSLLLWLRHVLDAEHHTRDLRRTFLWYDDLLTDWRPEVARMTPELGIDWPRPPEKAAPDVDQLLDRSLRHHTKGATPASMPDEQLESWVTTVSGALTVLGRAGTDAGQAVATLDRVRTEFDRATSTFRDAVRDELHQLRTSAADARAELTSVRQQHAGTEAELARLTQELKEAQSTAAGQAARLSELEGRVVTEHAQNQERVEELAMLTRRMLQAEARLARLTARRESEVSRLRARVAHQEQRITEQGEELVALQESTSWRVTAPLRTISGRVRNQLPAQPPRKD